MGNSHLPRKPNDTGKISYSRCSREEGQNPSSETEEPSSNTYMGWTMVLWPLVLHGIIAVGIAVFMTFYVHDNSFNFEERRPSVLLINGTNVPWIRFAPLQSDITTLISSSLAILRLITAVWLGPLCWRCAFILMEKTGLQSRQLYNMISYGIPAWPQKDGKAIKLFVWVILVMILPVHIIAPVLTGSITWTSYNQPLELPTGSDSMIGFSTVGADENGYIPWNPSQRGRFCIKAAGLANIAWGLDTPNHHLKRVLHSASALKINSTIKNVALPYFSVTKIKWIKDPWHNLTINRYDLENICSNTTLPSGADCPLLMEVGTVTIIPDITPFSIYDDSLLPVSVVSETCLIALLTHFSPSVDNCKPFSNSFPRDIGIFKFGKSACLAFAWVTYTAGASLCTECRVSSYATVQSDEEISATGYPRVLTREVLLMMPTVTSMMLLMGATTPPREKLNTYVTTLLSRSYAVSWTALTDFVGLSAPPQLTTYSPALPFSRAVVDWRRVILWLGIQLLVTTSGTLFIWVQANANTPLIKDTTLVAFYLDSHEVHEPGIYDQLKEGELLRLERVDGCLRVKVEEEQFDSANTDC